MWMDSTILRMVMMMNSTCYKQYDTRWASLLYPRKPYYIRNCGCGEVSICNAIIDMDKYKAYTPKTIQPYMVQFAESRGNGTYHYGIPTAMKHYGLTEVSEHSTMQKLWEQLRKGGRIAILLMGSRSAGSKKVHWTGSGHFVEVSAYKEEGGKHWVYVKDSASTSSYRNGWITYEDNIKGACLKCWSGKLNGSLSTATAPIVGITPDGKLTIDGIGGISTVKAMQRFFGTVQDGVIGGQNQSLAKWYPALKSVKYGKGGSPCIKNMQRWLGIPQDGIWGKGTSTALQKKIGVTADGKFGKGSMSAWQKYLNANEKAVYPTVTKTKGQKIAETAQKYVGKVPYKKGGTDINKAVDCTGFVQEIYRLNGIKLSPYLSTWGKSIGTDIKKAQPGDIISFNNKKTGKLQHHAIYIGNGKVCHATGGKKVCISKLPFSNLKIEGIRRRWK